MAEQIKQILLDNWSNLGLIIVGTFALVVYKLQKQDRIKSTATLLKGQIDLIEDIVKEIKSYDIINNIIVYKMRVILPKSYWEESKFLLVRELGADHVQILEEFYRQAEQLEKSRAAICHELVAAWEHKDAVLQEKYYQLNGDITEEERQKICEHIRRYVDYSELFTPELPIKIFRKNIESFRFVSGTIAYEKLSRISYYRG